MCTVKKYSTKGKSAHDLIQDEHLSAQPAVAREELYTEQQSSMEEDETAKTERQRIKNEVLKKLERLKTSNKPKTTAQHDEEENLTDLIDDERTSEEKAKL